MNSRAFLDDCQRFLILLASLAVLDSSKVIGETLTTISSAVQSGVIGVANNGQIRWHQRSSEDSDLVETEIPFVGLRQRSVNTKYTNSGLTVDSDSIGSLSDSKSQEDASENSVDDDNDPCLLHAPSEQMSWWIFPNGTLADNLVRDAHVFALDVSHLSNNTERIYQETSKLTKYFNILKPLAFSAAGNRLQIVPFKALSLVKDNLIYLSLRGNDFSTPIFGNARTNGVWSWAQFPPLEALKELDISNCSIQYLGPEVFVNIPNLQGLYLSHNKIIHLTANLFAHAPNIAKLDLSYIDSSDWLEYGVIDPNDDAYANIRSGLSISETTFQTLKSLIFLDLSHTKISSYSTKAFTHLASTLQFLSLCYTNILGIPAGVFSETDLRVLDLSGNPTATLTLHENSFKGINDTLEILSFENARLHDLSWIRYLSKLEIIQLAKNNINVLHRGHFTNMKNLRLLDLSLNHIGNWYHRIFEDNPMLQLLNLRDNNINILSTEMYRDFANLSFLALGHNDFICGCELRDLINIAVRNVDLMNYTFGLDKKDNQTSSDTNQLIRRSALDLFDSDYVKLQIQTDIMDQFTPLLKSSQENILKIRNKMPKRLKNGFAVLPRRSKSQYQNKPAWDIFQQAFSNGSKHSGSPEDVKYHYGPATPSSLDLGLPPIRAKSSHHAVVHDIELGNDICQLTMPDGQLIHFNFVLLDYQPENYWCYNSTTTKMYELAELEPCDPQLYIAPIPNLNTTHYLIIGFSVLTLALVLTIPLYLKWWYIKYIFIMVKRTTALKLLRKQKSKETAKRSAYMYDIFVSYCDKDRDWVLEELLPNVEGSQQISICLHERDFQVGISILENIIQCMDKSRCFLLVISKRFLTSQWCQFEMYLAQHRLFEARKEHLILIMLEDIPRKKRPKSLQYLMEIKTYIKWPLDTSSSNTNVIKTLNEERKLFWIRLNHSLSNMEHNIDQNTNESTV